MACGVSHVYKKTKLVFERATQAQAGRSTSADKLSPSWGFREVKDRPLNR